MANKRLRSSRIMIPPQADDFRLINGIGPGVAQRLYSAGILTFAQLAELSPEEITPLITDLASLSAERIVKQDWSGQARELAAKQVVSEDDTLDLGPFEPRDELATPISRQHYATFTVELLLDEENGVRRTHVTHVQDGSEDSWAGWHDSRLIDFFVERTALRLPIEEPVSLMAEAAEVAASIAAEAEQTIVQAAAPAISGVLRVRDLELVPAGAERPRRTIQADQPFTVSLTLDLSDVIMPSDTLLDCTATVYAKMMGGQRQMVGEAREAIFPSDTITVNVAGAALPDGLYRMEAAVVLTLPEEMPTTRGGLKALLEGGLLQVY
jgi:hypothetical protein